MVQATSQQQQLSEFLGEFSSPEFPEGSSTESEASVSGKNWAPGFIELTRKIGGTYWIQIAEIGRFELGVLGEMEGSYITLRGTEDERFVLETPEQIADLIRENWGMRVSGEAAMAAEYGTGDYKIGKDGWT
jgi:hypothetical protein